MCCIFTCVGWIIDLIQRIWVFAMSCCISSAISCIMITSSVSGIALGYNYSLAEYIDLKETNVSVYLKRGVFDDEISDDMDWRRAGNAPAEGQINGNNAAGPGAEEMPLQSGRRLDDSVFNSGNQNKFEGTLMKLTAKPLDEPLTKTFTADDEIDKAAENQKNELDKMKAVQGVLNKRRFNVIAQTSSESARRQMANEPRQPEIPQAAMFPTPSDERTVYSQLLAGRRYQPYDPNIYNVLNPARNAVPNVNLKNIFWGTSNPYFPTTTAPLFLYNEIFPVRQSKNPKPILSKMGPISTTTLGSGRRQFSEPAVIVFTEGRKAVTAIYKDKDDDGKNSGDETDRLGEKMRQELSRKKMENYPQNRDEDYDLDAKGLPARKKRHLESDSNSFFTSPVPELNHSFDFFSTETKPAILGKLISSLM